jgi:hypothetical protein
MNDNRILFFAGSRLQKIRSHVWEVIALIVIIYCGFHFMENPVVISIIIAVLLLKLLLPTQNEIIVYPDNIEFRVRHMYIPRLTKKFCFSIDSIQIIDANLKLTENTFILSLLMNSIVFSLAHLNTLNIKLKDGTAKTITTAVYKEDIVKALRILKRISYDKIEIVGV